MLTRRNFLTLAIAGGAALAGWRYLASSKPLMSLAENAFLNSSDQTLLHALVPVFLQGALSEDEVLREQQIATVVERFDLSCRLFYPRVQAELRELFDGLQDNAKRLVLTSSMATVQELDHAAKLELLILWREHFLALFNTAYAGLQNLIMAAFYGDEANWSLLDYAGPPQVREYADV